MDDVQYLRKHAQEESYLFLCDSKLRDANVFATPSEYEVQFASPFKNVFSVDLIDATVPRTEYTVEKGRNTVTYALSHPASATSAPANVATATVPPGDYILPQLVEALNAAFAESAPGTTTITVEPTTVPSEISNKLTFSCAVPFTFVMGPSGLRDALGFGNPVTAADTVDGMGNAQFAPAPGWTSTSVAGADMFLSVPQTLDAERVLEGPVPLDAAEGAYPGQSLRQHFVPAATGAVAGVDVFATPVGNADTSWQLDVRVCRANGDVVAAGQTATYVESLDNGLSGKWSATWESSGVMEAEDEHYVEILGGTGDAANHLAVFRASSNVPLAGSIAQGGAYVDDGSGPTRVQDEDFAVDVYAATQAHRVVSPGLVNLTGERYVLVRCPEIEQHMYRERAYEKYHAGLGMVKLAGYGYRDQRFDFVSFPPRRFHVIGKLSKLTIRLERPDGSLYNAHGVDHTLTLVIRYYAQPNAAADAGGRSLLNPKYTPELHIHLAQDRWAEDDEDAFSRRWR